jgi:uridine phosphorylase
VRRAIRVGTCTGLEPEARPGELLLVVGAFAAGGSAGSFGVAGGETMRPDPKLQRRLRRELGEEARDAQVASFDALPAGEDSAPTGAVAADMQTVAVLARGRELGLATAVVLIVETAAEQVLTTDELESAAKGAGRAASAALSTSS